MFKSRSKEIELFLRGIKPAILKQKYIISRCSIDTYEYHTETFRNSIILSHKEIPPIKDINCKELGIILGYYPKSCELFDSKLRDMLVTENEFIDFGGIVFNTGFLFEESLEWCIKEYKDKMLKHYDKIVVRHWVNKRDGNKVDSEFVKTIIIER